jgi:plastocyanin
MRQRLPYLIALVLFATSGFAKDVYLSVGGSVGVFRTDARIFNPSYTKDITITARYLPSGNGDNSGVAPRTITVAKRSMAVYDDVVQSLFGGGAPLGAVRLTSDDDFVATQRIYADESSTAKNGTLGQFVPGLEVATALKKGVLIQLKSNGTSGVKGTFRTNWGGVNPNAAVANIKFTLYDRNNAVAGTNELTLQPFGVFAPTEISGYFGSPARDLSNAWISFESDQPIFVYASVLDNGSTDPTFIPASDDTGVAPNPPQPQTKTVNVSAQNWSFFVIPSANLQAGDQVRFVITSTEGQHGFQLFSPAGGAIISVTMNPGETVERTITLPSSGTYTYLCTLSTCGEGHTDMTGTFAVGTTGNDDDRGGKY